MAVTHEGQTLNQAENRSFWRVAQGVVLAGRAPIRARSSESKKPRKCAKLNRAGIPVQLLSIAIMVKNTHQKAQLKTPVNELEAHQQLARIVSEVVKELEDGATQAMLDVCRQESR